jgi:hypothetical protein
MPPRVCGREPGGRRGNQGQIGANNRAPKVCFDIE